MMMARLLIGSLATASAFAPRATPLVITAKPIARPAIAPKMLTGLEGPALVQAGHTILAMNFMPLGPTAYGLGMGGKVMSPGQRKWGDRAFGNMMEHAPLFTAALWLHAVFVSPAVATGLGAIYLALRLMYPVIWALFGGEDGVPHDAYSLMPLFGGLKQIYYSTFPQYGIVFYMAFATVLKLAFGFCLNTFVKNPLLVAPVGFGYFLYHYAYGIYPVLQEHVFSKCFAKA